MIDRRLDYLAATAAIRSHADVLNHIANGDCTGDEVPQDVVDAIRRESAIIRGLVHVIEESVGREMSK